MHVESTMFIVWNAVPAVAYVGAKVAIWWSDKHAESQQRAERRTHLHAAQVRHESGPRVATMRLVDGPVGSSAPGPRS